MPLHVEASSVSHAHNGASRERPTPTASALLHVLGPLLGIMFLTAPGLENNTVAPSLLSHAHSKRERAIHPLGCADYTNNGVISSAETQPKDLFSTLVGT